MAGSVVVIERGNQIIEFYYEQIEGGLPGNFESKLYFDWHHPGYKIKFTQLFPPNVLEPDKHVLMVVYERSG